MKEKFLQDQQKFVYYQNTIHDYQDKNLFANKKIFYKKNKYYHVVINERPLKDFHSYIYYTEMAKDRNFFLNLIALNHKHLFREELGKIVKLNELSPNLQEKLLPIDWLVWYNFLNRQMRVSNCFYRYTYVQW